MSFLRFVIKRAVNVAAVLFATLILTVALVGPKMDEILIRSIGFYAGEDAKEKDFASVGERERYINATINRQIKQIGADQPWYSPQRFSNTVLRVMVLDLGSAYYLTSESGSVGVKEIILEKLPKTILLFTTSTVLVALVGLYLGAFVGNKTGSIWDRMTSAFAVFSTSFPAWWVGMLMIIAFAFTWHILPSQANPQTPPSDPRYPLDLLYHMILPLLTILVAGFGAWAFTVRYFIVRILGEDFIVAKRTAGIPEKRIVYSHALKNAAPPIITVIGLNLATSLSGAITIEAVFGWPGMGSLFFQALAGDVPDLPVVVGTTYLLTLVFVITVFVTDLIYAHFDPRISVA